MWYVIWSDGITFFPCFTISVFPSHTKAEEILCNIANERRHHRRKVNPFGFDHFYKGYLFGISGHDEVHPYRHYKSRFSINAISLSLSEVRKKNLFEDDVYLPFIGNKKKWRRKNCKRVIKWTILLFIPFSRCNKKDRKIPKTYCFEKIFCFFFSFVTQDARLTYYVNQFRKVSFHTQFPRDSKFCLCMASTP